MAHWAGLPLTEFRMPIRPTDSSRMLDQPMFPMPVLMLDRYVDRDTAEDDHLINTFGGSAKIKVDSTHTYNGSAPYYNINGVGRPSVRIESVDSWTKGLFLADIKHMPTTTDTSGCGVWPAFWTLGSGTWPYSEYSPFCGRLKSLER